MSPLFILAQQQVPDGGGWLAGGAMMLLPILLGLVALALFVWALVDAIKNPNLSDTERIVWILVIIFVGCLGPILYLLIGRNKTPSGPATHGTMTDEPRL